MPSPVPSEDEFTEGSRYRHSWDQSWKYTPWTSATIKYEPTCQKSEDDASRSPISLHFHNYFAWKNPAQTSRCTCHSYTAHTS